MMVKKRAREIQPGDRLVNRQHKVEYVVENTYKYIANSTNMSGWIWIKNSGLYSLQALAKKYRHKQYEFYVFEGE